MTRRRVPRQNGHSASEHLMYSCMCVQVSHEPFFCLLREVVSYGKGGKGQPSREVLDNPCADSFVLLHIECVHTKPQGCTRVPHLCLLERPPWSWGF